MGKIFKVRINNKEIKIGVLSDDGKRLTIFKKDSQIYRNFNSFGISEQVLEYLIKTGIKETLIIWHKSDDTEEVFKVPIHAWRLGRKIQEGKYELQFHLSLSELKKITNENIGNVEII